MRGPVEIAEEAWGTPLPDWIAALAQACALSSQAKVAKDIGRSGAVVSQVLRRCYGADMGRIEERVRGIFLDGRVICPALGDLPANECQDWRAKARVFAVGNPLRTRMFRACKGCPRNQKPEEHA
ncbi:MAG: hypothetical protein KF887_06975 [Paracoccaceae bacterium]|nr:MAG: hypothetical protein KF887_06975 [Paracoccaceae bacterium]